MANLNPAEWTIDSGATQHMCTHRHWFCDIRPYNVDIYVANNQKVTSKGIGNVRIKTETGFKVIKDVLYVPDLSANLISVSALTKTGLKVNLYEIVCDIIGSKGNLLLKAHERHGLYKLICDPAFSANFPINTGFCNLTLTDVKTDLNAFELWHKRLGHMSVDIMKKLFSGLVEYMPKFAFGNHQCTTCLEGKMSKKKFPKGQSTRASKVLGHVHTDVVDPINVPTFGGGKYHLNFVDDYSRMTFGFIIKSKSEVFHKFVEFKTLVENQTGKKIKILRSDNGTEYFNKNFTVFCKDNGILQQSSTIHTPQQNGVAKRCNRTILDKARCILLESKLDIRYWGEAVLFAIYLKNRSPTKAILSTPYEYWYGRKPNISHLRIFGSVSYVFQPKEKRTKFDPKAKPFVFVGYSERSKAYRLADPVNVGEVVIGRDVTFFEGVRISNVETCSYDYNFVNRIMSYQYLKMKIFQMHSTRTSIRTLFLLQLILNIL